MKNKLLKTAPAKINGYKCKLQENKCGRNVDDVEEHEIIFPTIQRTSKTDTRSPRYGPPKTGGSEKLQG
jgi:hypothetical protein